MKKIMILGASILQLPAIQKAKSMGIQVIVVDMNPNAIGFQEEGIIKEVISTIDIPAVVDAAKRHHIDGVMTLATDMPVRTVAAVSGELGIAGISNEAAIKATNKIYMRKALLDYGVPIPKYYKASNIKEYENIIQLFDNPFIVKPCDNSGSRGIYKIENLTDKNIVNEAYNYSKSSSRSGDVIVEEYMNGCEVSVESLVVDGECHVIQITDKLTTGAPHFVEMGHSQPTMLDDNVIKKIKEITIAANKAIGITNGGSHTEIIITKEGPKIVEIGARLGGDNITTHLVPLSTGLDMVECCIKIALGEKPDINIKWNKGSAIRYFKQHSGIIKTIKGIEEANKINGIKQISIVHNIGENVTDITDSGSRIGFVIAQDENAKKAIYDCEKATDLISVEICEA